MPCPDRLAIARGAATFTLVADATVTAQALATLATLPSFALNGHSLTLQDTPFALLAGSGAGLSLASSVVLANNTHAWTVSAADATRLAALPGFSAGSAGMMVQDNAVAILAPQNAAGLIAAGSVILNSDASISVSDALHLASMANFSVGSAALTIEDRAGALAMLSSPAATLASGFVMHGGGLVSVAQFAALRALPNLSTDGGTLIVVDSAANLATLANTPTGLDRKSVV